MTDLEFEELYNTTYEFDACTDLEMRFILLVGGRLGLRRGEIAHMEAEWIDWRKRRIDIPAYQDCDRGRDNKACGACRQQAAGRADYSDERSFEEAIAQSWQPKTSNAVRSVPFKFCPRVEIVLEAYFERFDRWMYSAQAINRRIDTLAERAGLGRNLYPHALRSTAASYFAARGMSTLALQSLFGWSQPSTADNYIVQSVETAERELAVINA